MREQQLMERSEGARRMIRDVATAIDTEPERYNQWVFAGLMTDRAVLAPFDEIIYPTDDNWCLTAFCIAGWNWMLHHFGEDDGLVLTEEERGVIHAIASNATGTMLSDTAMDDFDLTAEEDMLFFGNWRPKDGMTVGDALRAIAGGAHVFDVSS
jgi:hypothetical protein